MLTVDCHFIGAAHMDRAGRLNGPALLDRSNPGAFEECGGGAAFNVARIFAQLGGKAVLSTILGRDANGISIAQEASERGIELDAQFSTETNTATYTSIMQPDGQLVIALADMAIYDSFDAQRVRNSDAQFTCIDTNLPSAQLAAISEKPSGALVGLTVSAAKANRVLPVLDHLDMLFTNRAEAQALLNMSANAPVADCLDRLKDCGVETICFSNGKDSVHVFDQGEWTALPVPAPNSIVDVTGAGDALAGAALFGMSRNMNFRQSVEIGIQAAQKVIQCRGPIPNEFPSDLFAAHGITLQT